MGCLFCDILAGIREATFVYRDAHVAAFLDIQPINPGHVLIMPVEHVANLSEVPVETGQRMFQVAQQISLTLRQSGLRCEGVNLFNAEGRAAGQEVMHAHLHVFPRFTGDGFGLRFPPHYSQKPDRAALEETAAKIQSALEDAGFHTGAGTG